MKKIIYRLVLIICIAAFLISGFMIAKYFLERYNSRLAFTSIADFVNSTESQYKESSDSTASMEGGMNASSSSRLLAYQELYKQNNDLAGWLRIEGMDIDFPVMQTKNDSEYYLRRNFEKEYSEPGTPFADAWCDLDKPSDNIIIYGHHMFDGSMFAPLVKYESKEFYDSHPYIQFDTLSALGEYEIFAVFTTNVDANDPSLFKYYNFIDAYSEAEFNEYVSRAKSLSFYDTGVSVSYGDKLITLSTCEYTHENGRLAVVAKRVK